MNQPSLSQARSRFHLPAAYAGAFMWAMLGRRKPFLGLPGMCLGSAVWFEKSPYIKLCVSIQTAQFLAGCGGWLDPPFQRHLPCCFFSVCLERGIGQLGEYVSHASAQMRFISKWFLYSAPIFGRPDWPSLARIWRWLHRRGLRGHFSADDPIYRRPTLAKAWYQEKNHQTRGR